MSRPRLSAWYPPPIRHRPWTTHRMQSSVRSIGAKRCGTAHTAAPSSRFHRSKLRHQGPSFLLRHLRHVHRRRHQLQARRRRLWRALRSDLEGSENVAPAAGFAGIFSRSDERRARLGLPDHLEHLRVRLWPEGGAHHSEPARDGQRRRGTLDSGKRSLEGQEARARPSAGQVAWPCDQRTRLKRQLRRLSAGQLVVHCRSCGSGLGPQ